MVKYFISRDCCTSSVVCDLAEKMCLIYNACLILTLWMIMALREHVAARQRARLLKEEQLTPAALLIGG